MVYRIIILLCVFYENFYYRKAQGAIVMAYENRNAAYDLSLFDDVYSHGTAVPKKVEKESVKKTVKKANNVVTIPQEELHKIRRRKHNPIKIALASVGAAAVTFVIGAIIMGQVQLTELNQEIVNAQALLADSQSIYTQNQMKLEANLSNEEVERYAEDVLGMTKASNAQKEFITLSGGDKAEVTAQANETIFSKFIESIKNLWS